MSTITPIYNFFAPQPFEAPEKANTATPSKNAAIGHSGGGNQPQQATWTSNDPVKPQQATWTSNDPANPNQSIRKWRDPSPNQSTWTSNDPAKPKQATWTSNDPVKPKSATWTSNDPVKPRQATWTSGGSNTPRTQSTGPAVIVQLDSLKLTSPNAQGAGGDGKDGDAS